MLKKGEKAVSTAIKEDRCDSSVRKLYELMAKCLKGRDVPVELKEAVKTQKGLAMYSYESYGVISMSLNTLKCAATRVFGQKGWRDLEKRRRELHDYLQGKEGIWSITTTDTSWKRKCLDAQESLRNEVTGRMGLEMAYLDVLSIARTAAKQDPLIDRRLQRHLIAFGDLMRLRVVSS